MKKGRVLTCAGMLVLVLSTITAPPGVRAAGDNEKAIAEKFIAAWNSHDPAKMTSIFTDDVFYEDVAFGEVSHGKAELQKFATSEFEGVPDLELKLGRAAIRDDHGTIEWAFTGTDKADAAKRAFAGAPSRSTPGSLVRAASGRTTAVLDAAAASLL